MTIITDKLRQSNTIRKKKDTDLNIYQVLNTYIIKRTYKDINKHTPTDKTLLRDINTQTQTYICTNTENEHMQKQIQSKKHMNTYKPNQTYIHTTIKAHKYTQIPKNTPRHRISLTNIYIQKEEKHKHKQTHTEIYIQKHQYTEAKTKTNINKHKIHTDKQTFTRSHAHTYKHTHTHTQTNPHPHIYTNLQ